MLYSHQHNLFPNFSFTPNKRLRILPCYNQAQTKTRCLISSPSASGSPLQVFLQVPAAYLYLSRQQQPGGESHHYFMLCSTLLLSKPKGWAAGAPFSPLLEISEAEEMTQEVKPQIISPAFCTRDYSTNPFYLHSPLLFPAPTGNHFHVFDVYYFGLCYHKMYSNFVYCIFKLCKLSRPVLKLAFPYIAFWTHLPDLH